MKQLTLLLLLIIAQAAHGQSLSVFDVDASNFPTIKAKFYAFDAAGNQIKNLSETDFKVTENGTERTKKTVTCPNSIPVAVSSVLVFDMSGSMSYGPPRIESARKAANAWVDGLPLGKSECALVSFDDRSMILHDFTTDRTKLKNSIALLNPAGGTDYNQALIDKPSGGLHIARTGKNKRVLIFLTDGQPNFEPRTQDIIAFAQQYEITIYAVTLDMPAPQCIKDMTKQTGGQYFENITTLKEAEETYQKLLQLATNVEPCEITWESGASCTAGITNVELEITNLGLEAKGSYQSPNTAVAKLEFNPPFIRFQNPPIAITTEQKLIVTARDADYIVSNISTEVPKGFDIKPKSFSIKAGESIELTVSYTPTDNGYNYCKFDIESEPCAAKYYVSASWKGVKPKTPTLKVTHPNGGECFAVGSDTVITWEGVSPDDLVKLEYSINNGATWKYIDTARGLSYKWNNIPKPTSNQCLVRISHSVNSSENSIIWQQTLGGSEKDEAHSIIESSDGAYVIAGYTYSNDGDVSGNLGNKDCWIVKLNPTDGSIIWQKTLGWSYEYAHSIIESSDGAYVIAGYTYSIDGNLKSDHDYWIVKINPNDGSIIWQKTLGGSNSELSFSIIESSDGAYVIAGYTMSNDGDVSGNKGNKDCWIVKLNSTDGSIVWKKTFGGSNGDGANSIIESSDGAYVIAGYTMSNDGDVSGNLGYYDYWIVKINPNDGSIIWQKTLGGSNWDQASSIIESSDGAYVIAGSTVSNDGDVSGNLGYYDCWIVKLNSTDASIIWQKTLGGSKWDQASSFIESSDGAYVIAGSTESNDGDVSGNKGNKDCWIIKYNSTDASIIWQKTLGGSNWDQASSIIESSDGAYVIAGYTMSNDGDVSENKGIGDFWIVKLSGSSVLQSDVSDSLFAIVAPELNTKEIDMKQCLVAAVKDSVVTDFIINTGTYKCRVDSIYFTGTDKDAFSLVSGLPVYTIEAGKHKATEFRFKPTEARKYEANIVIITQAETLTQKIYGEGVQPMLKVMNNLIDFGKVRVGTPRDSVQAVTIKNIGSAPMAITGTNHAAPDAVSFSTVSGGGNFTIPAGETHKMDLRFIPSSTDRTNGILQFHYNGAGSPAEIILHGQGVLPEIEVVNSELDFGRILLGRDTTLRQAVTIANIGNGDLKISDIKITNPAFTRISGSTNTVLSAGDTLKYDFTFTPTKLDMDYADLEIYHEEANSPTIVKMKGEAYTIASNASAILEAGNISAYSGDIIELPIILKNQEYLSEANISKIKVDLFFNPTLLYPLDYPLQAINNQIAKITLDNLPANKATGEALAKVKFKAALGNAEDCELTLDNAEPVGGTANINLLPGSFTLLGICHEGGTRLVNPNANIGIQNIAPIPGKDKFTVTAKVTEADTKIRLIALNGKIITEIDCPMNKEKAQDFIIDLSGVAAGIYFIEFKSATFSQMEKVMVEK